MALQAPWESRSLSIVLIPPKGTANCTCFWRLKKDVFTNQINEDEHNNNNNILRKPCEYSETAVPEVDFTGHGYI